MVQRLKLYNFKIKESCDMKTYELNVGMPLKQIQEVNKGHGIEKF